MSDFEYGGLEVESKQYVVPKIHAIDVDGYELYVNSVPSCAKICPDISKITNDIVLEASSYVAGDMFVNLLDQVRAALNDPELGIAVVDLPESASHTATENAFWGVALSLSLSANLFSLGQDRINHTPYTVYAASYRKSQDLAALGLPSLAPETKLGFHTDGVLRGDRVSMPLNVMLYNISIEYCNPGSFYWVPFATWSDRGMYARRIGVNRIYRIKVAPSVYEDGGGRLELVSPKFVEVPIFVSMDGFQDTLYLNGDVVSAVDGIDFDLSVIEELRSSLAANKVRYCVPQKARRLILIRNTLGAHARDIFQEPNLGAPYTRIFMRSVDRSCLELTGNGMASFPRYDE